MRRQVAVPILLPLFILIPLATPARAQPSSDPVARSAGGVWLRPGHDPWAALGASPAPAAAGSLSGGVAYFAPAWGVPGLATSAAVATAGFSAGTIGVSVSRFGSSLYSETPA